MSAAVVTITYSNGTIEHRPLGPGTYQIGRDAGHIMLQDPAVSSRHAYLDVTAAGVTITDLGSVNGTYDANGNRLWQAHAMRPNEPVWMGKGSVCLRPAAASGGTVVASGGGFGGAKPRSSSSPVTAARSASPTAPAVRTRSAPAPRRSSPPSVSAPARVSLVVGSIDLTAYTGTVIDRDVQTAHQVTGSGGGGWIGPSLIDGRTVGRIDPVRIQTTVTTQTTLYLRLDDGREQYFRFSTNSLDSTPIRRGHRVTLIWASNRTHRQTMPVSVYIHQFGTRVQLSSPFSLRTLRLSRFKQICLLLALLVLIPIFWFLVLVPLLIFAVVDTGRIKQATNELYHSIGL